jgi:amidase
MSGDIWEQASAVDLAAAMDRGEVTAVELTLAALERVAVDQGADGANSMLEVNPDAVAAAEALDRERQVRGARGPLHGLPVVLKDNIDTGDRMHTSAGSLALAESYAPRDAFLVRRLRRAGAVVLGKANMTEWANFISDHMPSGYSSRGGQVRNPYGPGRFDPGGSSSGSAVAVATGVAPLAVGTETSGSILSPASQNGVVGIKPTVGLVSRTGVVPISFTQDTAGPIARTVRDAALLLDALAGMDEEDPATGAQAGRVPASYAEGLDPGALRGARLGVARSPYVDRLDEGRRRVFEAALEALRAAGATVVDPVRIATADGPWDFTLLVYEFKPALNAYLAGLSPRLPARSLADLIAYNQAHPDTMLRYGQALFLRAEATSGRLTDPEYLETRLRYRRWAREEGIDRTLADHALDAILFPNNLGAGIAAAAGYPSITVPAGTTGEGEPVGLTFTGTAFSEARLIALAYAFEQATRLRRPPPAPRPTPPAGAV